jgi:outer membrane immunogenic protein
MRAPSFRAIAVSAIAVIAAASVAFAADLAARPYTQAPVMVEGWNRTGFYVGGNAGYSWGRSNTDVSYFNTATGRPIGCRAPSPPAAST